jgi:hypothetical protein
VWKNGEKFFHCVEKIGLIFPLRGKSRYYFSIVWTKMARIFHGVENIFP